jgi:CRISPR-associated protein Csy1
MKTAMENPSDDIPQLRTLIDQFLQERLQPKLDRLKEGEDEKRQELLDAHRAESWIADAARRVGQIQQVSHAIKYSHPDARGTSLSDQGNDAAGELLVGTHTLQGSGAPDVVGNAAALDVLKFLRLEVNEKFLLTRVTEADPALAAALPGDTDQNLEWMEAFAGLSSPKGQPASHKLAKQLYWPIGDGEYHLLAPLFPTTLTHRVWRTIRDDRFSDEAKAAREAERNKQPHEHGFREYPNFAIQKFGGTKPQNISQLNSERYGENYLLASVPPTWQNQPPKPPLNMGSIFGRWFGQRKRVRQLTGTLRRFLIRVKNYNNKPIRDTRAGLVAQIRDELMQLAAELQDLPPGWSAVEDCRLNPEERYWLDPRRAREDEAFAAARSASDWKPAVCQRFGNWLNARLDTDRTPMDQATHQQWHSDLDTELRMMREELDDHA